MKKTLNFLIFSFIISVHNNIFSQKLSGYCPQKEIIKEVCKAGDSLARFMDNMKKTSSGAAWSQFIADAGSGPAVAFNNFGERGRNLRDTFNLLGNDLDLHTRSLITAINPGGSLTGQQVRDSIVSLISCYYADPVENNVKKLLADAGGPVPELLDGGPCEIAMRSCLSSAASTHASQLIACGFGTTNIIKWLGGWWGAGAGLVCLIGVEVTYNNAKWTCFGNYCDCVHCN
ncbi:MAG TPA: hypothetical protein VIV35_07185 [Chitinophagaceae bacterium]